MAFNATEIPTTEQVKDKLSVLTLEAVINNLQIQGKYINEPKETGELYISLNSRRFLKETFDENNDSAMIDCIIAILNLKSTPFARNIISHILADNEMLKRINDLASNFCSGADQFLSMYPGELVFYPIMEELAPVEA